LVKKRYNDATLKERKGCQNVQTAYAAGEKPGYVRLGQFGLFGNNFRIGAPYLLQVHEQSCLSGVTYGYGLWGQCGYQQHDSSAGDRYLHSNLHSGVSYDYTTGVLDTGNSCGNITERDSGAFPLVFQQNDSQGIFIFIPKRMKEEES
jgi:hypothetical protein